MSPLLLGRVIFTLSYCSIGAHFWARRQAFFEELATLTKWLLGRLPEFLHCSPRRAAVGEADCAAEEAWVQSEMEKIRLQFAHRACQTGGKLFGGTLVMLSVLWHRTQDPVVALNAPIAACAVLVAHVLLVSITLGHVRLTQFRWYVLYIVLNGVFCIRVWMASTTAHFYVAHHARFVLRTFLGLVLLDQQLSGLVNSVWTVVLVRHLHRVQQQSFGKGAVTDFFTMAVSEVWTTLVLQGVLWFAELLVKSNVRSNLGMIIARSVQRSVRRLLSVLCDAELHLTPDLKIREPSQKVVHLLAPDWGAAGRAAVENCSFVDFVAEADRGRFRSFMSSSGANGGSELGPAASIGLQLCDTAGTRLPVQLFYAKLPYLESGRQPDHLIGVRECGASLGEAPCAAAPGPAPGPGPVPLGPPPSLPEAATSGERAGAEGAAAEAAARLGRPCAPTPPGGGLAEEGAGEAAARPGGLGAPEPLLPGVFAQEFNRSGRVEDASSASSVRSRRSAGPNVKCLDLPVLSEVEVHFDLMTQNLAVKELHFRFTGNDPADRPQKPPMLRDWVHDSMWAKLRSWVQRSFNAVATDGEASPFGPLLLQWPSGGGVDELLLEASRLAIEVADEGSSFASSGSERSGAEEREDSEEDAPDQLVAVLRLRDFRQYVVRGAPPERPSGQQSKPRSRRSQGRPVQTLPSIDEASRRESIGGGHQGGGPGGSEERGGGASSGERGRGGAAAGARGSTA